MICLTKIVKYVLALAAGLVLIFLLGCLSGWLHDTHYGVFNGSYLDYINNELWSIKKAII